MNIDPSVSLAVSLQAHQGIYAVLLGSGVSRSAGIPTGWEIVLDLIRRLAALENVDTGTDVERWYRDRFGKEPDYSEIVPILAPTPAERTSLLQGYFEPTDEERQDGLKCPTTAHRAIARLVSKGYIKVIITTNFDRLLEQALEAEGVNPSVVSTRHHIAGMMPLPHQRCLVMKVNGDYLDTRIRNTANELAEYDTETSDLLDRVFTDYGLITCGWSGTWDTALVDAVLRNTRYRFTTFWMTRGTPTAKAKEVIEHRQAVIVQITGADEAFADIETKVKALASDRAVDPISPRLAVALIKKYLSEPKYRIQLEEAVTTELAEVCRKTDLEAMPLGEPVPDKNTYVDRVQKMEAACSKLVPMVAAGAYWDQGHLDPLWKRCVEATATTESVPGRSYQAWSQLRNYSATMLAYAVGVAAILRRRYSLLRVILVEGRVNRQHREPSSITRAIGTARCFDYNCAQWLHKLRENEKRHTPGSDWLVARLDEMLSGLFGEDIDFEDVFDHLELIVALVSVEYGGGYSLGRFAWRGAQYSNTNELIERMRADISDQGEDHALLQAGFFRTSKVKLIEALDAIEQASTKMWW